MSLRKGLSPTFRLGDTVSVAGQLGTVRYHGPLSGSNGKWYGVEMTKACKVGNNGSYRGTPIFKCKPGHGVFLRGNMLRPRAEARSKSRSRPGGLDVMRKNASSRLSKSPPSRRSSGSGRRKLRLDMDMHAASSEAKRMQLKNVGASKSSRTGSASSSGTKRGKRVSSGKRRPSAGSTKQTSGAPKSDTESEDVKLQAAAAVKIQAVARGARTRAHLKQTRLLDAFNKLDALEESELKRTHKRYEALKQRMLAERGSDGINPLTKAARPGRIRGESNDGHTSHRRQPSSTIAGLDISPRDLEDNDVEQVTVGESDDEEYLSPSSVEQKSTKNATTPRSRALQEREKDRARFLPDGLELQFPLELDYVTALLDHFKYEGLLLEEDVLSVLTEVESVLRKEPNVVRLPVKQRLTVVGDLHGQLTDLLAIIKLNGLPSPRNWYLFNGDFVDRGQYSCEVVLALFAFKLLYPHAVFLNRGNHEARDINSRDGFEAECLRKYSSGVFDAFSRVFACLPLASVVNGDTFVVHGGLPWKDIFIRDLERVDRFHEIPGENSLLEQILWADPCDDYGRYESSRGAGLLFGPDVTKTFLQRNKISLIIRSHELQDNGFSQCHNDTLITVFSASNYCGTVGNDGAFVIIEPNAKPKVVQYYAKPKEKMCRMRMRHALLETDIISRLLDRICFNRIILLDEFHKLIERNEAKGMPESSVSRRQWAAVLSKVLKLDIPFMDFQEYLGLPKLGVNGKKGGPVDPINFLSRFVPVLRGNDRRSARCECKDGFQGSKKQITSPRERSHQRKRSTLPRCEKCGGIDPELILTDPSTTSRWTDKVKKLVDVLYKNRLELETLFCHFDMDGDEFITLGEFETGLLCLRDFIDVEFTSKDVLALLEYFDQDGDGIISYNEFFHSFKVMDPQFQTILDKSKRHRATLKPVVSRQGNPSKVVGYGGTAEKKE